MINYALLKCAFGKHGYGRMVHDDTTDRWIKICRNCSTTIEVDAPKDDNGEPIDSHAWLRMENERDYKELRDRVERYLTNR